MTRTDILSDFESPDLLPHLSDATDAQLDALPFGVIGFDAQGLVQRYNQYEAQAALFDAPAVIGQHVFVELAPCLNNYLVAGRYEEAAEQGHPLDETLPYVLTFRMRPTRVRMRLLWAPGQALRYILVQRGAGSRQ